MKETKDIIDAYELAIKENKQTALATVVHLQGSSYRRPGARMLITEDGMLTGAISGGCLEGDALRKALLAIVEGKNKLVTYDTTDEDDAKIGIQLGCNGIVHILFEPIDDRIKDNPIAILKKAFATSANIALVTLFSLKEKRFQIGTCFFCEENGTGIATEVLQSCTQIFQQQLKTGAIAAMQADTDIFLDSEHAGRPWNAFIQIFRPPVSLIIVGAGNDALPMTAMAYLLGWKTTLIDGRNTHATKQRFPSAEKIIVAKPESSLKSINITPATVFVLMTHNYNYDLAILKQLLPMQVCYIGVLGPKSKMQRMYNDLANEGIVVTSEQKERIYSPVGLDIGAETAEEIAVSVIAEIKATLAGKNAQMLRHKLFPIHS